MEKDFIEKIGKASKALEALLDIFHQKTYQIVLKKIVKYEEFPSNKTIKIRRVSPTMKVIYGVPQKNEDLTDMGHRKIVDSLRKSGLIIGGKDVSINFCFLKNIQQVLSDEEHINIVGGFVEHIHKPAKRVVRTPKRKEK